MTEKYDRDVPKNLPDEIKELITDILWGGDNIYACLALAEACCRLQREQDYNQYTGVCHELKESSPLIVSKV